jgi:hypothetical protein
MPNARWIGPFDAILPGNRWLRVGDTLNVSDAQAESAHWENLDSPAPRELAKAAVKTSETKTSDGGDD